MPQTSDIYVHVKTIILRDMAQPAITLEKKAG